MSRTIIKPNPGELVYEAAFKKGLGPGNLIWLHGSFPDLSTARQKLQDYAKHHHPGYRLYSGPSEQRSSEE